MAPNIRQDAAEPADIERLIELAKGGEKAVAPRLRPRVKELREQGRELFKAARYAEALPLLTEPADIERLIELAKGGEKAVAPRLRPRVKELREQGRELFKAARYAEALPLLTELAELTANPAVLTRIARILKQLDRRAEARRLRAAVNARAEGDSNRAVAPLPGPPPSEPVTASQRANYAERYGGANCGHLLRINEKTEAFIQKGVVPPTFERLVPL